MLPFPFSFRVSTCCLYCLALVVFKSNFHCAIPIVKILMLFYIGAKAKAKATSLGMHCICTVLFIYIGAKAMLLLNGLQPNFQAKSLSFQCKQHSTNAMHSKRRRFCFRFRSNINAPLAGEPAG